MNQGLNPKKLDSFIQTRFRNISKELSLRFCDIFFQFLLDKTIQRKMHAFVIS